VQIIASHLEELTRRIETAGGRSSSQVASGEPAAVIAETGKAGAYTLIVVGKFGRGWVRGKLIGSTAAQVCEAARRPVLMIPGQAPD
jgi:nucleotide-binding universal stress UspA family protein